MPKQRTSPKFKRAGLHRLECATCATYVYGTVAQIETRGLPICPVCREPFYPERIELAEFLECDDAPVMIAYRAKCSSVAHGQAWTGRDSRGMKSADLVAYEQISREQRKAARQRRIAAILPKPEPIPF